MAIPAMGKISWRTCRWAQRLRFRLIPLIAQVPRHRREASPCAPEAGQEEAQRSSSRLTTLSSVLIPKESSGVGRYRRASATVSVLVCGNTLCSYSAR